MIHELQRSTSAFHTALANAKAELARIERQISEIESESGASNFTANWAQVGDITHTVQLLTDVSPTSDDGALLNDWFNNNTPPVYL